MRTLRTLIIASLFAAATAIPAAASPSAQSLDADAIRSQQAEIRTQALAREGRYAGMAEARRQQLLNEQSTVLRLLDGKRAITDLPEKDRIAVFNSLEAISAIINNEDDERMVCRRHKPVGSNRPTTICKTVAQLAAERRSVESDEGRRTLECSEATMGPGGCLR